MMASSLVLIVSLGLLLFPAVMLDKKFNYDFQVGVVEFSPEGRACLTIQDALLKEGTSVDLILLASPQAHSTAAIEKKLAKACAHNAVLDPADSFYELRLPLKLSEEAPVAFGVAGFSGEFQRHDGFIRADLDGDGLEDAFRSCTSREGVHLRVWNGEPRKGTRKWHRYHYLGFDVEPDCTEKDY